MPSLSQCTITGSLYDVNGDLVGAGTRVSIMKTVQSGQVILHTPDVSLTNASGVVALTAPRSSTIYVYAKAIGLEENGIAGVALAVPNAGTANLEDLISVSTVPSTGITVKDEGTAFASLVGTINFVGTGVSAVETSAGLATVTITAGGGSLTLREVDGTPSFTATTLELAQASGFVVTDQGSNVGRIDLLAVPVNKLAALTASRVPVTDASGFLSASSVTSTTLAFLDATSSIQTQLNAKQGTLTNSAGLAAALSDETGSPGLAVFNAGPTFGVTGTARGTINFASTGAAKAYEQSNGNWAAYPVPYFRPLTTNSRLAFDLMPNGTLTGEEDVHMDICSTDITADSSNFECLELKKTVTYAHVGTKKAGTGVVQGLAINENAGKVTIGAVPDVSVTAQVHIKTLTDIAPLTLENTVAAGFTAFNLKGTGRQFTVGVGNSSAGLGVENKFFIYDATGTTMRLVLDSTGLFSFVGDVGISGSLALLGTVIFPDNVRQTFNPGANAAGLNVGSIAGDPDTLSNGDLWYDSSANELSARINGATVALGAGGGGGATTALDNLAAVAINTSLLPASNQSLGSATLPWLTTFTGSTTQYESVVSSAGLITHAALGSAADIGFTFTPKGTANVTIGVSTNANQQLGLGGNYAIIPQYGFAGNFVLQSNNTFAFAARSGKGAIVRSDYGYGWENSTDISSNTRDTVLLRDGVAGVQISNGTASQWGYLKCGIRDAGLNTAPVGLTVGHQTSGTKASITAGMGVSLLLNADSTTTADQNCAQITALFTTPTHASIVSDLVFYTRTGGAALAEAGRFTGAKDLNLVGNLQISSTKVVGAQGAAVADASGGSVVDVEARSALNALLARLRTHGLIAT